jgi:uncharacterized membrane protein YebE (DUF533 family)
MINARQLIDALIGGRAPQPGQHLGQRPGQGGTGGIGDLLNQVVTQLGQGASKAQAGAGQVLGQATSGVRDMAHQADQATGVGTRLGDAWSTTKGPDMVQKAKDLAAANPSLAQAAIIGAAGLLLSSRDGRRISGNLASLGGLALIGGLAYKAFQNYQAGKPVLGAEGGAPQALASGGPAAQPSSSSFDPETTSEDDAMLYVRAMVAAASADGHISEPERQRIINGLEQAGIDPEAGRWLEREFASPATIDELSDPVRTPEKAAQVYAAARIAIEPDTMQEREFLRRLAEALDLDPALVAEMDVTAAGIRARA